MPRVVVVFTGGTIAMRVEPGAGGAVPVLDGSAIVARTPGLDGIADVEPIDWGLVPASHMGTDRVIELARVLAGRLDRPDVDGAVLVQGTDTIEEIAFGLDLLLPGDKPLAVVGAMRTSDSEEYDGPDNLRAAVRAAASPKLRRQGVVVTMGGRIWPADDVMKMHTTSLEAFAAPNRGSLGLADHGRIRLTGERGPRRRLDRIPDAAVEPVDLLTAVSGMDGRLLRLAVRDGARGIVVAATGSGNTHPDLLEAAREAMGEGIPVVLASRCLAGGVHPTYGFPGGGARWLESGAIPAGSLSGPKARLALSLALGAGLAGAALRAFLADPVGPS